MKKTWIQKGGVFLVWLTVLLLMGALKAHAAIDGLTGNTFNLTAKTGRVSTADGGSILIWGYANGAGSVQYPGPTLIVNQGDTITINLTNELPVPVSIVFPGQTEVGATGGAQGLLTREVPAYDGVNQPVVTYTFTALQPGTYTYYSGTNQDLQIEMGLVGAIIVRPAGYMAADPSTYRAYNHPDSQYRREFLAFLTEMDPTIHQAVEFGLPVDTTAFWPVYWFINGRTGPDTMAMANVPWLPTQPYNCMPRMHPGEKVLLRIIGGGREAHPFHTHGNHVRVIARNGELLESAPGAGADLSTMEFTVASVPGQTVDTIYQWTGEKMGWDIYGTGPDRVHSCIDTNNDTFDDTTYEYCPDHGKPFPVTIPLAQDMTFGPWYSGSPYLGAAGALPPGEGGLNPTSGFLFMWHSHNENEIVNFNIFPGGMLTMAIVEPPSVEIME